MSPTSTSDAPAADRQTTVTRPRVWPRVLVLLSQHESDLDVRTSNQCRTLLAAGYDVSVIGPPPGERIERVHYYERRCPPGPVRALRSWWATSVLCAQVLRQTGFDVVQWSDPPGAGWMAAAPYRPLGKRLVYDRRDPWPGMSGHRHRQLWRSLMDRASSCVAHSVVTARPRELQPALRGTATWVPTGPRPLPPASAAGRGSRASVLCCCLEPLPGRSSARRVLEVWSELVHVSGRRDVRLVVLAHPADAERLTGLLRRLALTASVEVWPGDDATTVSRVLASADLAVSGEVGGALPDAVLDGAVVTALAAGLPHAVFDGPDLRRVLHTAGVYATAGDVGALAACVRRLADDRGLRRALGRQALRRADSLQWRLRAPDYVHVFDALLGLHLEPLVVLVDPASPPLAPRYVVRVDARAGERRQGPRRWRGTSLPDWDLRVCPSRRLRDRRGGTPTLPLPRSAPGSLESDRS